MSMLCLLCRLGLILHFACGPCSCGSPLLSLHLILQANASLKQDVLRSLQQLVPTMIAAGTGGADLVPQHGQGMVQQQRHNQQMLQAVLMMQRRLLSGGIAEQPATTAVPAEQLDTAQALAKGLLTGAAQLMKVTCS